MRGNVIDLAVGVIIGAAFGKIVSSLVADILMPIVGVLVGGVNFTALAITLKQAVIENGTVITPAVTLNYGNFLQAIFDFLIVAWAIFLFIKLINKVHRKKAAATPAAPPADVQLLTEIRDLLKQQQNK